MARNTFTIVQSTFGEAKTYLCVVPSNWIVQDEWKQGGREGLSGFAGNDLCFWPKSSRGYRLVDKAKKKYVEVDPALMVPYRCRIKRSGFQTYNEATMELKRMELDVDTDGYESSQHSEYVTNSPTTFNEYTTDSVNQAPCKNCRVVTKFEDRLNHMEKKMNQCLMLLAQANAKIDSMLSQSKPATEDKRDYLPPHSSLLHPVETIEDLEATESKCLDPKYVEGIVKSMEKIHGKNLFTGNGWTVCLQSIDYFIDRKFLRQVSWTGISKTKDRDGESGRKIALSQYKGFINLFFQVILHADKSFTLESCHKFLKQCLRNSKQRLEEVKRVRTSVARKRRLVDGNTTVEGVYDTDEIENVQLDLKIENDPDEAMHEAIEFDSVKIETSP